MRELLLFFIPVLLSAGRVRGQGTTDKMAFVIDSLVLRSAPSQGDDLLQDDIADQRVIRNKDSLTALGFGGIDGVSYIFTKEYRARTDSLRKIPCARQMVRKEGAWYFHDSLYTGPIREYYVSGRLKRECQYLRGRDDGFEIIYFQNGRIADERWMKEGHSEGPCKHYYKDGSLQWQGNYTKKGEEGRVIDYYPNGRVKQLRWYKDGALIDSVLRYYSDGRLLERVLIEDGKEVPDPRLKKVHEAMQHCQESSLAGDPRSAARYVAAAIRADSGYAEAWFAKSVLELNDREFDQAIADLDRTLLVEPYMADALINRAFARIRKNGVIPPEEQTKICQDLQSSVLQGSNSVPVRAALQKYCQLNSDRL